MTGCRRLHGVPGELVTIRAAELDAATHALGVRSVEQGDFADGRLGEVPVDELAAQVSAMAERTGALGLVVFDPSGVTWHRTTWHRARPTDPQRPWRQAAS